MIDFTPLSDDQLVELARAVAAECARRGQDVHAAAYSASLDEVERQRIAAEAAARAAERLRREEEDRIAAAAAAEVERNARLADCAQHKLLARAIREVLGDGWELTVWNKTDLRVYLDRSEAGRRGYRNVLNKTVLYVTGDGKGHKPGGLYHIEGSIHEKLLRATVAIMSHAAELFPSGIRMHCTEHLATDPTVPDLCYPDEIEKRMASVRQVRAVWAEENRIKAAVGHRGGWVLAIRSLDSTPDGVTRRAHHHPFEVAVVQSADDPTAISIREITQSSYARISPDDRTAWPEELLALVPDDADQPATEHRVSEEDLAAADQRARAAAEAREAAEKADAKRAREEERAREAAEKAARKKRLEELWPHPVVILSGNVVSPLHGVETPSLEPAPATLAVELRDDGLTRIRVIVPDSTDGVSPKVPAPGNTLVDWEPAAAWPAEIRALIPVEDRIISRLGDLPSIPPETLDSRVTYIGNSDYYGEKKHSRA